MSGYDDLYGDSGESLKIFFIGAACIFGFVIISMFLHQIVGVVSTDGTVEKIKFKVETKYTKQLSEGTVCKKPEGEDGAKVKEYKIVKRFGNEVSRELTKETITREVINEVQIIGTTPKKHGYCQLEGYYRHRYVKCYGDYTAAAKNAADARANLCNTSPYNEAGCTDSFESEYFPDTKNCSQIDVDNL